MNTTVRAIFRQQIIKHFLKVYGYRSRSIQRVERDQWLFIFVFRHAFREYQLDMHFRGVGFDLGETLIFYRDTPLNWAALYPDALRAAAGACGVSPAPEQLADPTV